MTLLNSHFAAGSTKTLSGQFGYAELRNDHHFTQSAFVFAILQKYRFFHMQIFKFVYHFYYQILQPKTIHGVAMGPN